MCKIFAMTSVEKIKMTSDLIEIVRDAVCKSNDRDGFGYAVNTLDGEIWGERTMTPFSFDAMVPDVNGKTKKLPIVSPRLSNRFGPVGAENNVSFIAHGRLSTNKISLANTHPFLSENVALVHNGVVSDPNKAAGPRKTSCDTEILLNLWEQDEITAIEENAGGYYAIAILDRLGQLHIIKDDCAMLYVAFSPTAESYLIATTAEIIKDIASRMKWEIEPCERIMPNVYAVFRGNELHHNESIRPLGWHWDDSDDSFTDSDVQKALGQMEYVEGDREAWRDDLAQYESEGGNTANSDDDEADNAQAYMTESDLANDDAPADDDAESEVDTFNMIRDGYRKRAS